MKGYKKLNQIVKKQIFNGYNLNNVSKKQNNNVFSKSRDLKEIIKMNGKNNKKRKTNKNKNFYSLEIGVPLMNNKIFFVLLLIINTIIHIFPKNICSSFIYFDSYITLKINGIGDKNILTLNQTNFKKSLYPNFIYINDERQDNIDYHYNFNQIVNEVKLVWNHSINDCQYMFQNCYDIIEIDLSEFDFSKVKRTNFMFSNCYSLKSINFKNVDTSQVTRMNRMFENCLSLSSIDVSNFDTSKVEWMNHLFFGCSSLTTINISNFNSSITTDMEYLFSGCSLLTSIDLSKFDTSFSRQMPFMFSNCISLISLNLSNFDVSNVNYTYGMFANCTSLVSLDISNFNTQRLINMHSMFYNCRSLTSLNLSKFDTSHVTNMRSMFYGCSSLSSLDLSNFDTSKAIRMHNMFDGCINLEYINLINFRENNLNKNFSYSIFDNVPDNIVLCINDNINIILDEIKKIKCYSLNCSDNWQLAQKKLAEENGNCMESCLNKYEYNGKCYGNCLNGDYLKNSISKCKCELIKCFTCSNVSLSKELCTKCNDNFYPMEDDPLNLGGYFNCYDNIENYYLDRVNKLFKKCFYTCQICEISGSILNHNCLKCNSKFSIAINNNNYFNCYNLTNYGDYFDSLRESNLTAKESNKKLYETIVNLFADKFDILNENEKIIEGKDDFYCQLTTVEDELKKLEINNNTNKFSKIDLGECENILKEKNNIHENISLLIFKYEKITNITKEGNL